MKSLGKRATGLRLERMRASPRYRVTEEFVEKIAPRVVDTAERISRRMGHRG